MHRLEIALAVRLALSPAVSRAALPVASEISGHDPGTEESRSVAFSPAGDRALIGGASGRVLVRALGGD